MKNALMILLISFVVGCHATGGRTVPSDRAAIYLGGIAHAEVDACGETYSLIIQYGEASVPVVTKALDLYADATNAPTSNCRILNAVMWVYKVQGDSALPTLNAIMRKAAESPNPDIKNRGTKWLEWEAGRRQSKH